MRVLFLLAIVLAAFSLFIALGKQPEPFPEGSVSASLIQPGVREVESFNIELIDASRPTQANGDFPGTPERRLQATVWHPEILDHTAPEPGPLVVYSHGFYSTRYGGAYLAEHLASIGYVVVATDYPLTNMNAPGPEPLVQDVINQPEDVSFLIDTLLRWSADEGHTMHGLIDRERIGITGLSLGGLTTILTAYHPELRDPRVKAALAIAGPSESFTYRFFQHREELPFLMLAGDIDAMVPYDSNALPVLERVPGAQLVTIRNGSHTGFSGPAAALRWLDNPDSLGCRMIRDAVQQEDDEAWYDLFGSPEQGIVYDVENRLCLMDPLPEAMNVLRQHMITTAVVRSFFESHFGADQDTRVAAGAYLNATMAEEIDEVSHQRAAL